MFDQGLLSSVVSGLMWLVALIGVCLVTYLLVRVASYAWHKSKVDILRGVK